MNFDEYLLHYGRLEFLKLLWMLAYVQCIYMTIGNVFNYNTVSPSHYCRIALKELIKV